MLGLMHFRFSLEYFVVYSFTRMWVGSDPVLEVHQYVRIHLNIRIDDHFRLVKFIREIALTKNNYLVASLGI